MKVLLIATVLCQYLYIGQQMKVYADCIGVRSAQSMNPTFIMQYHNVARSFNEVWDFNVLSLCSKTKQQFLSGFWQIPDFDYKTFKQDAIFSPCFELFDRECNDEKKPVKELDDNSSEIAEAHCNDRTKCIQKNFYKLNVSFEEINDFKVGLHILLILSIMYLAKKTYDQISK